MHTASHDSFGLHPEEDLKTSSLKYYWFAKGLKGFKWASLLRRVRGCSPMGRHTATRQTMSGDLTPIPNRHFSESSRVSILSAQFPHHYELIGQQEIISQITDLGIERC